MSPDTGIERPRFVVVAGHVYTLVILAGSLFLDRAPVNAIVDHRTRNVTVADTESSFRALEEYERHLVC